MARVNAEKERAGLPICHFADRTALEAWLAAQPPEHRGAWLKIAKKDRPARSVTLAEAVDAGLCFGWIDGLVNRFDEDFYLIRYTPRRPRSKWSLINVERAEQLLAEGRVKPGGLKQIEEAKADGRWTAAYPPASRMEVPDELAAALAANPEARDAFYALSASARFSVLYRLFHVKDANKKAAAVAEVVAMLASRGV